MKHPRRPTDAELRQIYIDEHWSCPEIAKQIGADPSTVRLWLVAAGIPTRRRGHDTRVHFKKGAPSAFKGRRHTPEAIAKVRASTVADGRVPYLRHGLHWLKTVGPERHPKWLGGVTPERQTFYRTPEWRAACRFVWQRSNAHCERCDRDHREARKNREPKFHVHHILSFQVPELRAHPSNLVLLCRPCHMFVHSNTNVTREYLPQDPATAPLLSLADFDLLDALGIEPPYAFSIVPAELRARAAKLGIQVSP